MYLIVFAGMVGQFGILLLDILQNISIETDSLNGIFQCFYQRYSCVNASLALKTYLIPIKIKRYRVEQV